MENELKNPSRTFRSEKFAWLEFLALRLNTLQAYFLMGN